MASRPYQKNRRTAASNPAVLGWQVAPQSWRWGGGWLARFQFQVLNIPSAGPIRGNKSFRGKWLRPCPAGVIRWFWGCGACASGQSMLCLSMLFRMYWEGGWE